MQCQRKLVKFFERFQVTLDGEKHNLYLFSDLLIIHKKSSIFSKSNAKVITLLDIISIKSEKSVLFILEQSKLYELSFDDIDFCEKWTKLILETRSEYLVYLKQDKIEPLKKQDGSFDNVKILNVKIIKGVDFELCHSMNYKDLYCII